LCILARILMLNKLNLTFVKRDYGLLKELDHEVDLIAGNSYVDYFRQITRAKGFDLYFSWWGTSPYTVLFAEIFGGKSVIVAGGFDAAEVPEIGYGAFTTWKKHIVRYVFQTADMILAVSKNTKREVLQHAKPKNIRVMYNGVDVEEYKPEGKKEDLVVTVSELTWSRYRKKGLETFVRSAGFLPDIQFVLIGRHKDADCLRYLQKIASPNVRFSGYIPFQELLDYYRRAKVYVQVSFHESFGVALAEAMACECVPVATKKAALPEVVGDTGFYVPYGNQKATVEAIKQALNESNRGKEARRRIKVMFPLQKRKEELLEVIKALVE
jgi:glycosyltransferase involved in cell wall biosynthesis